METYTIDAQTRTVVGKKVKQIRRQGLIPGIIYGKGFEARRVSVDCRTFKKTYAKSGESSLVDLALDGGAAVKVLIQDVQYGPLTDEPIHIDFRQVNMNEKLEVQVALRFVGESLAVKALGAILVKSMDHLTIRCLPAHLVHEFDIDISRLAAFGDTIKVKDIVMPAGVEMLANENDVIALVTEPISEAEFDALNAKPEADVSQVKVASEEKKAAAAADAEKKETE